MVNTCVNPEFRILRLTFHKMLNSACYSSISDISTVYLKAIDYLNLKLHVLIFCRHCASFKI